jgi:hypothetical protein
VEITQRERGRDLRDVKVVENKMMHCEKKQGEGKLQKIIGDSGQGIHTNK